MAEGGKVGRWEGGWVDDDDDGSATGCAPTTCMVEQLPFLVEHSS